MSKTFHEQTIDEMIENLRELLNEKYPGEMVPLKNNWIKNEINSCCFEKKKMEVVAVPRKVTFRKFTLYIAIGL